MPLARSALRSLRKALLTTARVQQALARDAAGLGPPWEKVIADMGAKSPDATEEDAVVVVARLSHWSGSVKSSG